MLYERYTKAAVPPRLTFTCLARSSLSATVPLGRERLPAVIVIPLRNEGGRSGSTPTIWAYVGPPEEGDSISENWALRHDATRTMPGIASRASRIWVAFPGDRKSTRLNSSHRTSSYAVFC